MLPAISVGGLRKAYGPHPVLQDVSFDVAPGEVVCLLGPNGAGKTTTVEILEGYRTADAGQVRILGIDPAHQPLQLRRRIGIVLQECALPADLRVREVLDSYRSCYPRPRPTQELLALVELEDCARSLVRTLSGGQQRRLDLALALVGDPDLVFLDEPTTGFDPAARRRCWAAIEALVALGKTVLLTTHYLDEAEVLADRILVLLDGEITASGTVRELAAQAGAGTRVSARLSGEVRGRMPRGFEVEDRVVRASTREAPRCVAELLAWASRAGVQLSELEVVPPRLEDIYLDLVALP